MTICSSLNWWAKEDLNLRPHAYQARALTNWATSPFGEVISYRLIWWLITDNWPRRASAVFCLKEKGYVESGLQCCRITVLQKSEKSEFYPPIILSHRISCFFSDQCFLPFNVLTQFSRQFEMKHKCFSSPFLRYSAIPLNCNTDRFP